MAQAGDCLIGARRPRRSIAGPTSSLCGMAPRKHRWWLPWQRTCPQHVAVPEASRSSEALGLRLLDHASDRSGSSHHVAAPGELVSKHDASAMLPMACMPACSAGRTAVQSSRPGHHASHAPLSRPASACGGGTQTPLAEGLPRSPPAARQAHNAETASAARSQLARLSGSVPRAARQLQDAPAAEQHTMVPPALLRMSGSAAASPRHWQQQQQQQQHNASLAYKECDHLPDVQTMASASAAHAQQCNQLRRFPALQSSDTSTTAAHHSQHAQQVSAPAGGADSTTRHTAGAWQDVPCHSTEWVRFDRQAPQLQASSQHGSREALEQVWTAIWLRLCIKRLLRQHAGIKWFPAVHPAALLSNPQHAGMVKGCRLCHMSLLHGNDFQGADGQSGLTINHVHAGPYLRCRRALARCPRGPRHEAAHLTAI